MIIIDNRQLGTKARSWHKVEIMPKSMHDKRFRGPLPKNIDAFIYISEYIIGGLEKEFKADDDKAMAFFNSVDQKLMRAMNDNGFVMGSEFAFMSKSKDCTYYFACRIKKDGFFDSHYIKARSEHHREAIKLYNGYALEDKQSTKKGSKKDKTVSKK